MAYKKSTTRKKTTKGRPRKQHQGRQLTVRKKPMILLIGLSHGYHKFRD